MLLKILLLIYTTFFSFSALAQDYDELVEQAAARFDDTFLEHWSFTETRTANEEIRYASYDPVRSVGNGWELLSLNGEAPDEDAIADFLEEKAERKAEREESEDEDGLFDMVTPGSLELLEENSERWRFSFQPRDEEDEEFMEHVAGELVVVKKGRYLGSLTLRSRGPFKPRTGVKINEFEMQMQFSPVSEEGPIVPQSLKSRVSGKAFLVATIEEDVVVEFSDYKQVIQPGGE